MIFRVIPTHSSKVMLSVLFPSAPSGIYLEFINVVGQILVVLLVMKLYQLNPLRTLLSNSVLHPQQVILARELVQNCTHACHWWDL